MSEDRSEVAWSSRAKRSLNRLPEKVVVVCVEFAYGGLATNPRQVGKPLRFDLEGVHSARRGDFRVIYVIDEELRRVTITNVQHRSDVYRPR
ncbi:MAG: type II toxin-antitoxin system RelE/ParE family toxin [Candidatus Microthrix subdominans]|jgi:mRNA interferase RelE/StbE